jgi:hypothetical protein
MAIRGIPSEGARKNRATNLALDGGTEAYMKEVQAQRRFALLGAYRFLDLWLRPFPSVEEAEYAFDIFFESIKKRYGHVGDKQVDESDISFEEFPDARLVDTHGHYMGGDFHVLSVGRLIGPDIIIVEINCPASSEWPLHELEEVVRRQSNKLEGRTVNLGIMVSDEREGVALTTSESRQILRAKRQYWLGSRPVRMVLLVVVFVVLIFRWV